MTRFACSVAAGAVIGSLVALSGPAQAGPPVSWSSDDVGYPRGVCMQKAFGAFTREGWGNVRPSGSLGTVADKGPFTGLILCLGSTIAVVYVTGADVSSDDGERSRLQFHMTRE